MKQGQPPRARHISSTQSVRQSPPPPTERGKPPVRVVYTLVISLLAMGAVKLLGRVTILYGRRRFAVLILLAFPHADFAALLPLQGASAGEVLRGSLFSANWYTEAAFLLFFLGHFEYEKRASVKVIASYAIGSAAVLLFLAVFYGVFSDIAIRQQNAVAQISKYTTSFTSLGRVDYLFIFAIALVMIFRLCVPAQMCVHCLCKSFGCKPMLPAAAVNILLLALTVFFSYSFLELQTLFTQRLWFLFALFAYALPAAALLLKRRGAHE